MEFRDQEVGVVSKASSASCDRLNHPPAGPFASRSNCSVWCRQRDAAQISGSPFFHRNTIEFLKQLLVISLIRGIFTGVSSGIDSRSSLQSIHLQSAVFTVHPAVEVLSGLSGFFCGVLGKSGSIFDDFRYVGENGDRDNNEAVRGKDFRDFLRLFSVSAGKHNFNHGEHSDWFWQLFEGDMGSCRHS